MTSYLPHHDVFARVLVFDADGAPRVAARDALPADAAKLRGFFVEEDGEPFGVVAGTDGPELILDGARVALRQGRAHARVAAVGDARVFTLDLDGAPVLTATYVPPGSTGGAWDDDQDLDFYSWLAQELEDPKFYTWFRVGAA
jgi:hypothetical protein